MLAEARLNVSPTAELGDALLAIVKHDVQKETVYSESRRRLETFVLRAETLVARLAERQEALEAAYEAGLRREGMLRGQVASLLDTLGQVEEVYLALTASTAAQEALLEAKIEAVGVALAAQTIVAQEALEEVQRASEGYSGVLEARIVRLEARTLPARWRRLIAWCRGWWS